MTTTDARKRNAEADDSHAGCTPGTCRDGDQWRTITCTPVAPVADMETRAADEFVADEPARPDRETLLIAYMLRDGYSGDEVQEYMAASAAAGVLATPAPEAACTCKEDGPRAPDSRGCGRHGLLSLLDEVSALRAERESAPPTRCPTCGPTTTEPHPRRRGVLRCVNCKEWLAGPGRTDTAAVEALARLTSDLRAVVAKVDRSWGGAAMVVRDSVAHLLGDRCTNEFCEHDHVAIRAALAPRATTEGSETDG